MPALFCKTGYGGLKALVWQVCLQQGCTVGVGCLQARELRVSRNNQNVAIERRSDLYKDKWVEEAALRYLGRKSKQDGLFPALQVQVQAGPQ